MKINHTTGIEGQVELVGYRAVVAMFLRWTLTRRGEDGSGNPVWTLRASLSFQKDSHLLNKALKKKITIRSPLGEYVCEPVGGSEIVLEHGTQLVVEGVKLCRVEKP